MPISLPSLFLSLEDEEDTLPPAVWAATGLLNWEVSDVAGLERLASITSFCMNDDHWGQMKDHQLNGCTAAGGGADDTSRALPGSGHILLGPILTA